MKHTSKDKHIVDMYFSHTINETEPSHPVSNVRYNGLMTDKNINRTSIKQSHNINPLLSGQNTSVFVP